MSTTKPVRLIGLLIIVAGALMFVAGGVTWNLVTTQLKAENVTVAAVSDKDPGKYAGKLVAGPFTAYAQANAINHHALDGAKGRTYAQIGDDAKVIKAKLAAGGMSEEDIKTNAEVVANAATRTSTMNGSFLRASLFTSVISFGVAALVMGLGILFALLGFALVKVAGATVITSAPAKVAVPGSAKA